MKDLFKNERPRSARRIYRVETLNSSKGIFSSMRLENNKYKVCLCLPYKTKSISFLTLGAAKEEMKKYRSLYKELK